MKARSAIQDPILFVLAVVLSLTGLLFAFDAGFTQSMHTGHGVLPSAFITQCVDLPIAIALAWGVTRIGLDRLRKATPWLAIGMLVALVLVLVGPLKGRLNGADRWLDFRVIKLQPAEFAKVVTILFLAGVFATRKAWPTRFPQVSTFDAWWKTIGSRKLARWRPVLGVIVALVLIEREPDLGTALVVAAITLAMVIVGGATRKSVLVGLALAVVVVMGAIVLQPYRFTRLQTHSQRWDAENIDDTGYQAVQSEIFMARGGWQGVGLFQGHAKRMLPAATTDFVMATVAEETGLLGSIVVLSLLGGIVWRLLWRASLMKDRYGQLCLIGVASWLAFQGCVNLLQANGTLPTVGIPFPFVSSGGSSLLALWIALGITEAAAVAPAIAPKQTPEKANPQRAVVAGGGRPVPGRGV